MSKKACEKYLNKINQYMYGDDAEYGPTKAGYLFLKCKGGGYMLCRSCGANGEYNQLTGYEKAKVIYPLIKVIANACFQTRQYQFIELGTKIGKNYREQFDRELADYHRIKKDYNNMSYQRDEALKKIRLFSSYIERVQKNIEKMEMQYEQ